MKVLQIDSRFSRTAFGPRTADDRVTRVGRFIRTTRLDELRQLWNVLPHALERVRPLSNLETEKSKLLQILLVEQRNLRDTIASPELEQFRQRVAVSYHLMRLDAQDTAAYINYRLRHAAIGEPLHFPADAAALVHTRSRGVPRIINVICDAALVFGYAEERREITLPLIRDVLGELEMTGILPAASDAGAAPVREAPPAGVLAPPAPPSVVEAPAVLPAAVHEQALARAEREVAERAASLVERERRLAQRERELVEQRRVLAEEHRLLRNQRVHTGPAPAPFAPAAGTPLSSRPDGLRGWLKRLLSGGSHSTVEGS